MKKYLLLALVLFIIGCTNSPVEIDLDKEKAEIKASIESLMMDRSNLNYEGYISWWLDDPGTFLSSTSKMGHTFMTFEDLKNSAAREFEKMKQIQTEGQFKLDIVPHEIMIKVYNGNALAHFKNKWTRIDTESDEREDMGESFIIVSFEKMNEEWKVAFLSAVMLNFNEKSVAITEGED
jgi:hypothetical protein